MKIRKFNENKDDVEIGPIDRSEIDPYNEENWSDKDHSHTPGVCINCGSDNIDYRDTEHYGNTVCYEYTCLDCEEDGQEVYDLIFVINERN